MKSDVCEWIKIPFPDITCWESSEGLKYTEFPKDNLCPYCGKPIRVIEEEKDGT